MYPCIHINLDKIAENARVMKNLTEKHHIEITGVTKVFGGEERIAQTLVNQGIKRLGDSRIENIRNYGNLSCEKWLIRKLKTTFAEQYQQLRNNAKVICGTIELPFCFIRIKISL